MEVGDGSVTKLATSASGKRPRHPSDSKISGAHFPSGHGEKKASPSPSYTASVQTTVLPQVRKILSLKLSTTHSSNQVVVSVHSDPR